MLTTTAMVLDTGARALLAKVDMARATEVAMEATEVAMERTEAPLEATDAAMVATEAAIVVMEATKEAMAGVMVAEVIILHKLREVKLVVILAALCEVEEVVKEVGEQEVAAEGCKGKNLIRGKSCIRDP